MRRIYIMLLMLLLTSTAKATEFKVNTTVDGTGETGPNLQTLRWAITEANSDASANANEPHIITIEVTGTIILTSQLPSLSNHIKIVGPEGKITIQAYAGIRSIGMTAGNTIVLQNLIMTGGGNLGLGGAVLNNSSDLTMINCDIFGNTATQRGGGIYSRNLGGGNPIPQLKLRGCKVYNNISSGTAVGNGGGGIYSDGPLIIENSQIYSNTSQGPTTGGAGIFAASSATVTNSSIYDNTSFRGGGGGIYIAGALNIVNTKLYGNVAKSVGGGAIYKTGGGLSSLTELTVRNNSTDTNSGTHGAGMFFNSTGSVTIQNSVIHNNQASAPSSGGGGIRFGNAGTATIINSTFFGNSASGAGGAISNASTGKITLSHSTLVSNSAGVGGGFWAASTTNSWINYSIVSGNTSPNGLDLNGSFNSEYNYNRFGSINGYTWVSPNPTNTTGNNVALLFGTSTPQLADNGATEGVTQTIALSSGTNPAILTDAALITSLSGFQMKDQRGFLRNNPNSRSIGAFERDGQAFYLANIESDELLFVIPGSSLVPVSNIILTSSDGNLSEAHVEIVEGYKAGKDELVASQLPQGITSNWNSNTGILTLSGDASPLAYQNALRGVAYQNNNAIDPDFGRRTISFKIIRNGDTSNTLSRILNVTPPPPPAITSIETEVLEYVTGCNGFVSYRLTNTGTIDAFGLNTMTAQITGNYQADSDLLSVLNLPVGMTSQFDPNAVGGGKLTLSGNFSGTVYQQVLRNLVYSNTSTTPDLSERTITVKISDGFNPSDPQRDTRSRQVKLINPSSVAYAGQNMVYPSDAVVNILCYRADLNQGEIDATPYIMQAIAEHTRDPYLAVKRKVLYFPNGTYKLSDGVFVDNLNATFTGNGNGKGIIFQGQSQEHTILKLTDNNPRFQDTSNPRPALSNSRADFQPGSFVNVAFKQGVFNLTINIGSGNPGASGLRFIANNQGSVRDVTIKSNDGQGWAGIDMERAKIPGPSLIKNVTINGFDYGIRLASPNYSMVMEHIIIKNSRFGGILNTENVLSIRKLTTSGLGGPAIISKTPNSMITLLDSELAGSGEAAIVNEEGFAFIRNVKVAGFGNSLMNHGTAISGDITEFVHGPILKKWEDSPNKTLNIKKGEIPDAPEVPWDLPENWVDVCDFAGGYIPGVDAANPQDIGPAIRAAIAYMNEQGNEQKTTLYLKPGIYTIATPVTIYGNVRRYVGNYAAMFTTSELENQTTALFKIESTNYPAVVLEGISLPLPLSWNSSQDRRKRFPLFENNSDKDVVIQNVMCHTGKIYRTGTATGRVFIEDIKGGNHSNVAPEPYKNTMPAEGTPQFEFRNQEVYARQLNPEQIENKVLVDGGSLYVLGLKTEKFGTLVRAINGAEVEILGGQSIAADNVSPEIPAFEVINAKANFIFTEQISVSGFTNQLYFKRMVAETRGDDTRFMERDEVPKRLESVNSPVSVLNLYIARPKDIQLITFSQVENKLVTDAPINLSATATSGLPVSFVLINTPENVAIIENGIITIKGAGIVTVSASQEGDENYAPAPVVEMSFEISKLEQTITFNPLVNLTYQANPLATFELVASSSSALPVSFELLSGPATIEGNLLTITGIGEVIVTAIQNGDKIYLAAEEVSVKFNINHSALPVTLISYTAKAQNNNAVLNWVTASEITNNHFVIKRSTDGKTFNQIAIVNAKSALGANYAYTDYNTQSGTNYYRLLQVDLDGKTTDLGVKAVTITATAPMIAKDQSSWLNIYPNSSNGRVTIAWGIIGDNKALSDIKVYSQIGQLIFQKQIPNNELQLDLSDRPAGVYHVQVSKGMTTLEKSLIIK